MDASDDEMRPAVVIKLAGPDTAGRKGWLSQPQLKVGVVKALIILAWQESAVNNV